MPSSYVHSRRVEFVDTDMAGIVHFSRFLAFMEAAEHAFLRALGFEIHFTHDDIHYGFPRVSVRCDYRRPARAGDLLTITVAVKRKGRSSITWGHTIRRDDEVLAVGEIVAVCCRFEEDGRPRSMPLPAPLDALLEPAPADADAIEAAAASTAG